MEDLSFSCLSEMRYQSIVKLWSFYVTRSPRVDSWAPPTQQSLVLKDDGWDARATLKQMERRLFSGSVKFVKPGEDFTEVARKQGLYADRRPMCSDTQAVVKILTSQSGKDKSASLKESQAGCVFRHIRNSLAHGLVYKLPKGKVLFKDMDRRSVSGYVLTAPDGLIELMRDLKRRPTDVSR